MTDPPSGNVTFLFTDVQGSTALWDQHHDLMHEALTAHDNELLSAIESNGGYVFSTAGDSFGASFATADLAVAAATQAQQALANATTEIKLKIRMGLHTGQATIRDGNYFGIEVNRAARIMGIAHGGQILLSRTTADLLSDPNRCVDMGEHRLKDLRQPQSIFQFSHPELPDRFPKLEASNGSAGELPAPITRFVGREIELIEVNRLLTEGRLVTLTGSGGAGKTRLALQVASDAHYQFPDGLRIVELAGISEGEVLVDEVAQVFQVQAAADVPIIESLVATIGSRRGLLILDNCEQLIAPVKDLVATVLASCSNMTVLCTSRELLDVTGEVVYRVPSLSIPSIDVDVASAHEYDAVTLFMDRAKLSNPDFALVESNLDDVVAICTRLDGIPLALELAAARLRVMSPTQIAGRLDERFLLVAAESTAGSRHQTLQNAIDWSYNLLSENEQIFFQRLSGFTGDFSLEAVEAVCGAAPLADVDLGAMFFGLIDKSMIMPEHGAGNSTRYRLLDSMRNYGLAALDETDGLRPLLLRHLRYYTEFCESLQALQRAGKLGEALATLDENEDNIRAALRFGLLETYHLLVARIIGSVGYLWYAGGLYREGSEWCSELFGADPDLPDATRAAVLHAYGTLLGSWSQPSVGAEMLEQEVVLRRRLADPERLAAALNNLGNLQHDIGRFDDAEATLREAIEQFRLAGEAPTLALASLGAGYLHAGELEQATELYAEALEEALADDDTYGLALATSHLGQCAALQGDQATGRDLLEEARERFNVLTVTPGVANADFHLAMIERAEGNRTEAARRLLRSLSTPEAHWYLATQYWIVQVAASLMNNLDDAISLLGVAKTQYDRAEQLQPAFVLRDLDTTTDQLRTRLNDDAAFERALAKGRRRAPRDAIAMATAELAAIVASTNQSDAPARA